MVLASSAQADIIESRLSGGYRYLDSEGETQPVAGMRLEIRRASSGVFGLLDPTDILLDTIFTDSYGNFDVTVEWDYDSGGHFLPSSWIYMKLYAETNDGTIQMEGSPADDGGLYTWVLEAIWSSNHSLGMFGIETPADEALNFVFHALSQTRKAKILLADNWEEDLGDVSIIYPDVYAPTGGMFSLGSIYLPSYSIWRDDHLFRLLGHIWLYGYYGVRDYDLCNGTCDDTATICSFCDWCEESETAAWNEGFALFFADEVTRWMQAENPTSSLLLHDFETIDQCDGEGYGTPSLTPGNVAALLLDLVDPVSANDYNPEYLHYDSASDLLTEVLYVVKNDNPDSVMGFLSRLFVYYGIFPELSHNIWYTAKSNGFDTDTHPPGMVTNLSSPSHAIGGSSIDATVDFTWETAFDVISGTLGYSVLIANGIQMPPATISIGNVSSYTSEFLDPGTYYMNIRAVDWAGNWSLDSQSYGPFTIMDPDALDLDYLALAGWDYLSFPSQGFDNSVSSAHVTPVMTGNTTGTHFNIVIQNTGPASISEHVYIHAFVDDQVKSNGYFWSGMPAGAERNGVDMGDFTVRGGRHNFHTMIDGRSTVTETDEDNNIHGRQFIWTGLPLTPSTVVTRNAPPYYLAGATNVTNPSWYVCDGLSFETPAWWCGVAVRPESDIDNYGCRLHDRSSGSESGFSVNQAYSARPTGTLDAVIVNRNMAGLQAWDVSVLNPSTGTTPYNAVLETTSSFTFGDSLTFAFDSDRMLMLNEVHITAGDTGYVSVNVDIGSATAPVTVQWLYKTFETGTLIDYTAQNITGSDGRAQLHLHIPEEGYYCVVIYRDAYDVTTPIDITMEVGPTDADLLPYQASGWHAPLVPRPAADGSNSSVPAPETLSGNVESTYFNLASTNQGYLDAVNANIGVHVDGVSLFGYTYPLMPVGAEYLTNNPNAFTVRGGRHTVSLLADAPDWIEEMDEENNTYGHQYVWSPLPVPFDTGVTRDTPPDPIGGWSEAGSSWYNCDGLRIPTPSGYWSAAAIMPTDMDDNPDLRLHDFSVDPTSGFAANRSASNWGNGQSDFVVTNFNLTGLSPMDVGVIKGATHNNQPYRLQTVQSVFMGNITYDTWGPFTCNSDEIIGLYEWYVTPGEYFITLENVSGLVDWGLSALAQDMAYLSKNDVLPDGSAWLNGPGEDETLNIEITESGYFCLGVWKRSTSDLDQIGEYRIQITNPVSGVADETIPRVTRMDGVAPNPFNPNTTISYSLEKAGRVHLEIFDLTGARVATLVDKTQAAGSQKVVWPGTDTNGRTLPSGAYMARLMVDGQFRGMSKLLLVK